MRQIMRQEDLPHRKVRLHRKVRPHRHQPVSRKDLLHQKVRLHRHQPLSRKDLLPQKVHQHQTILLRPPDHLQWVHVPAEAVAEVEAEVEDDN